MPMNDRYLRQTIFPYIGEEGQKKLFTSRVAVLGLGALGTVTANNLARSGVGYLRLIDRDYVEATNLQRQVLFDERDAAEELPKAEAARRHLSQINSEIGLDPVVSDVNSSNIANLINDVDLVIDATDNFETRMLLNEACLVRSVPWIYGGAIGSEGMSMNILHDGGPCYCCLTGNELPLPGTYPTCSTAGVLNTVTNIVASIQCTEALKYLVGDIGSMRKELFYINVWENRVFLLPLGRNDDCSACVHHRYEYYDAVKGAYVISMCGSDSFQVVPDKTADIDFREMADKLMPLGKTSYSKFTLDFERGPVSIKLFRDGRAIVRHVKDENQAKSLYSEYIGL
ncbi:MAG TPA: ThiF family adenylyltransferase [Synergistaceae bacterium]|jgi:molybdopterin/thiamine biosynthesis adenylyltransferase|nr:ThiF family adenylyltransferase [Synergistaceae bacterium]